MDEPLQRNAKQFAKFAVVGGSGVFVNLTVFVLVLVVWGCFAGQIPSVASLVSRDPGRAWRGADLLANAAGFIVSVSSNYYLNRRWTFRSSKAVAIEMPRFVMVSAIAYAGQLGAFWIGLTQFHLGRTPSQLIAIACVMPINFVANKFWSFR